MSTTLCRAKGGPSKCKNPRCPAKLAQQAQIAAFFAHPSQGAKAKVSAASKPVSPKAARSQRALKSSLTWDGSKPTWWDSYVAKAQAEPDVPCTPELLDVVDSPLGKLAVVWQHESFETNDVRTTLDSGLGQNVCYYLSLESGERMGYLKLSHMDEQTFERTFGNDEFTPFRFKERYGGSSFGLDAAWEVTGQSSLNLSGEALLERRRNLWFDVMRKGGGVRLGEDYVPGYALTERHIPQDDERIEADLQQAAADYRLEMEQKLKNTRDPYVEFSRMDDHPELMGQGFGTALYIYAARRLGKDGKRLTASGVQSGDAKGLWENLRKNFPTRVKNARKTYGFDYRRRTSTSVTLDFRVKKAAT